MAFSGCCNLTETSAKLQFLHVFWIPCQKICNIFELFKLATESDSAPLQKYQDDGCQQRLDLLGVVHWRRTPWSEPAWMSEIMQCEGDNTWQNTSGKQPGNIQQRIGSHCPIDPAFKIFGSSLQAKQRVSHHRWILQNMLLVFRPKALFLCNACTSHKTGRAQQKLKANYGNRTIEMCNVTIHRTLWGQDVSQIKRSSQPAGKPSGIRCKATSRG